MNKVTFITGNKYKADSFRKALSKYPVDIEIEKIETPEIQETDVVKVAEYSAKYAAEKLNKPIVVTDAGIYIKSLNDFPGSFQKFMNKWFTPTQILQLLDGVIDRSAIAVECLSYCEPDKKPVSFLSEASCRIALKAEGNGSTIDQIIIWPDMDKVQGLVDDDVMTDYWAKQNTTYKEFGEYLLTK